MRISIASRKNWIWGGTLLVVSFLCSCANTNQGYYCTEIDAIRLAVSEFDKRYPARILHYSISITDDKDYHQWNVWFHPRGKVALPGGYKLIRVKKTTGACKLEPSF